MALDKKTKLNVSKGKKVRISDKSKEGEGGDGANEDVDIKNAEGATALMLACQREELEHVQELIKTKASVAVQDATGKTAVHYCVENSSPATLDLLLKQDGSVVNHQDGEGFTALHLAVIANNKSAIETLVKHDADCNILDNEKHNVIHWATVCGHVELIDYLQLQGAKLNKPDMYEAFPLHYAAQMCESETKVGQSLLLKLLEKDVDIDCRDQDKRTPLHWAASAGSKEALEVLLKSGASPNTADKDGLTALHCVASRGHPECIDLLVHSGANVDAQDKNGCTPLFYAFTTGYEDCAKKLLKHNADPSHTDHKGRTPAHCAAAKGSVKSLKLIKSYKGDLWIPNIKGERPAHEAALQKETVTVDYLVRTSSDPKSTVNVANEDNRTLLHIAAITNNVALCQRLLEHGAKNNPTMRNKLKKKDKKLSPYQAALLKGSLDTAEYLAPRTDPCQDDESDTEWEEEVMLEQAELEKRHQEEMNRLEREKRAMMERRTQLRRERHMSGLPSEPDTEMDEDEDSDVDSQMSDDIGEDDEAEDDVPEPQTGEAEPAGMKLNVKKDSEPTDQQKTDGQKTDQQKTDGQLRDQQKTDQQKTDGQKTDQKKTDGQLRDQQKTDQQKTDGQKTDQQKTDGQQTDQQKTDGKQTDQQKLTGKQNGQPKRDSELADQPKTAGQLADQPKKEGKQTGGNKLINGQQTDGSSKSKDSQINGDHHGGANGPVANREDDEEDEDEEEEDGDDSESEDDEGSDAGGTEANKVQPKKKRTATRKSNKLDGEVESTDESDNDEVGTVISSKSAAKSTKTAEKKKGKKTPKNKVSKYNSGKEDDDEDLDNTIIEKVQFATREATDIKLKAKAEHQKDKAQMNHKELGDHSEEDNKFTKTEDIIDKNKIVPETDKQSKTLHHSGKETKDKTQHQTGKETKNKTQDHTGKETKEKNKGETVKTAKKTHTQIEKLPNSTDEEDQSSENDTGMENDQKMPKTTEKHVERKSDSSKEQKKSKVGKKVQSNIKEKSSTGLENRSKTRVKSPHKIKTESDSNKPNEKKHTTQGPKHQKPTADKHEKNKQKQSIAELQTETDDENPIEKEITTTKDENKDSQQQPHTIMTQPSNESPTEAKQVKTKVDLQSEDKKVTTTANKEQIKDKKEHNSKIESMKDGEKKQIQKDKSAKKKPTVVRSKSQDRLQTQSRPKMELRSRSHDEISIRNKHEKTQSGARNKSEKRVRKISKATNNQERGTVTPKGINHSKEKTDMQLLPLVKEQTPNKSVDKTAEKRQNIEKKTIGKKAPPESNKRSRSEEKQPRSGHQSRIDSIDRKNGNEIETPPKTVESNGTGPISTQSQRARKSLRLASKSPRVPSKSPRGSTLPPHLSSLGQNGSRPMTRETTTSLMTEPAIDAVMDVNRPARVSRRDTGARLARTPRKEDQSTQPREDKRVKTRSKSWDEPPMPLAKNKKRVSYGPMSSDSSDVGTGVPTLKPDILIIRHPASATSAADASMDEPPRGTVNSYGPRTPAATSLTVGKHSTSTGPSHHKSRGQHSRSPAVPQSPHHKNVSRQSRSRSGSGSNSPSQERWATKTFPSKVTAASKVSTSGGNRPFSTPGEKATKRLLNRPKTTPEGMEKSAKLYKTSQINNILPRTVDKGSRPTTQNTKLGKRKEKKIVEWEKAQSQLYGVGKPHPPPTLRRATGEVQRHGQNRISSNFIQEYVRIFEQKKMAVLAMQKARKLQILRTYTGHDVDEKTVLKKLAADLNISPAKLTHFDSVYQWNDYFQEEFALAQQEEQKLKIKEKSSMKHDPQQLREEDEFLQQFLYHETHSQASASSHRSSPRNNNSTHISQEDKKKKQKEQEYIEEVKKAYQAEQPLKWILEEEQRKKTSTPVRPPTASDGKVTLPKLNNSFLINQRLREYERAYESDSNSRTQSEVDSWSTTDSCSSSLGGSTSSLASSPQPGRGSSDRTVGSSSTHQFNQPTDRTVTSVHS